MGKAYLPVLPAFNTKSEKDWQADSLRFFNASHATAVVQTASFSADIGVFFYPCDTTAGGFTATLPSVDSLLGKPYAFKNTGVNVLTLAAAAGETIDGSASVAVASGTTIWVVANGVTQWYQILAGTGGGSGGSIATEDEGISVDPAATTLNFVGAGVTATDAGGGTTDITIPGAGTATITTKEEGVVLSAVVTTLDFTGAGVTASGAGATTTVNIPGNPLEVKDEGVSKDTAVTSIDFTGTGVTATNVGHAITVNVPGATAPVYQLEFLIGDGVNPIVTGLYPTAAVQCPRSGTITGWTILSVDAASPTSGAIVLDIWKDTYAGFPPDVSNTIIPAGTKPTVVASATKAVFANLTSWTTTITAGDIFFINVDSVTSFKAIKLMVTYG